jgi:SAM-dependent methyltransferase
MSIVASTDALLEEQTEYYRRRGAVSDDWFYRRGRYDRGPILNRQWFYESVELIQALLTFELSGKVLELGGSTGFWTKHIAMSADQVTVLDVSPESIAASRARLGPFVSRIRYVEADVYRWTPNQKYDAVFFAFWISHVPPHRFDDFWAFVQSCLKPNGRVFTIETQRSKNGIATDHRLPRKGEPAVRHRLDRKYHVYKTFYTPASLGERLQRLGWTTDFRATREFFLYGSAKPPE